MTDTPSMPCGTGKRRFDADGELVLRVGNERREGAHAFELSNPPVLIRHRSSLIKTSLRSCRVAALIQSRSPAARQCSMALGPLPSWLAAAHVIRTKRLPVASPAGIADDVGPLCSGLRQWRWRWGAALGGSCYANLLSHGNLQSARFGHALLAVIRTAELPIGRRSTERK